MYLSKVKIKEMMEQQGIKTFAELAKRKIGRAHV